MSAKRGRGPRAPRAAEKIALARYKGAELCIIGAPLRIGEVVAVAALVGIRLHFDFVPKKPRPSRARKGKRGAR